MAGIIDIPEGPTRITAGEFSAQLLSQDIQVKEGEALRATLSMIVQEMPNLIKGNTLVCKIDNQVVKPVLERKDTFHNLALNSINIGKSIDWLMEKGQSFLSCEYVQSELNVSDKFTSQSPDFETSLTEAAFRRICDHFWALLVGLLKWQPQLMLVRTWREPLSFLLKIL